MFQTVYIDLVEVTVRSSRTIIFKGENQIRNLRADFQERYAEHS